MPAAMDYASTRPLEILSEYTSIADERQCYLHLALGDDLRVTHEHLVLAALDVGIVTGIRTATVFEKDFLGPCRVPKAHDDEDDDDDDERGDDDDDDDDRSDDDDDDDKRDDSESGLKDDELHEITKRTWLSALSRVQHDARMR